MRRGTSSTTDVSALPDPPLSPAPGMNAYRDPETKAEWEERTGSKINNRPRHRLDGHPNRKRI